ncbi:anti-sigma factor [Terribacillus saccharophilus]|uniref:anti-sigma factor n=1 Tax=Terribacillus saccharophilus TaxID=361277 RepID=UPI002DC952B7|nr:anti-sigma factor [Terribacillus saccharophilus]
MQENNCERLLDYLNGQLTNEETAEFEKHLATCPSCREELEELQQMMEDLPYASEAVTPPAGMKDRVLDHIFSEEHGTESNSVKTVIPQSADTSKRQKRRIVMPVLAAALAASLLGNVYLVMNERENTEDDIPEERTIDLDETRKAVDLAASEGYEAQGSAAIVGQGERGELIVQAANLEALEGEEAYQVWLLKDGVPSRAGTFLPDTEGKGAVSFSLDGELQDWDTVAITKEPTPESETPQGDILLSAPLI